MARARRTQPTIEELQAAAARWPGITFMEKTIERWAWDRGGIPSWASDMLLAVKRSPSGSTMLVAPAYGERQLAESVNRELAAIQAVGPAHLFTLAIAMPDVAVYHDIVKMFCGGMQHRYDMWWLWVRADGTVVEEPPPVQPTRGSTFSTEVHLAAIRAAESGETPHLKTMTRAFAQW